MKKNKCLDCVCKVKYNEFYCKNCDDKEVVIEGADDDPVTSPSHYKTAAGLEAIDVMESFGLGLHLGNAVKYILRAGKKDDYKTDLRKAIWWLQREVDR